MLRDILSITGKPGLYKLVSRGNNMLIVESLLDGKRVPTYSRDKIVSLGEISMYTMGEDIALSEVLTKLGEKEGLKVTAIDPKKADNDELREFFGEVLPEFDRDRVYPSDIRKLIQWYNILINAGITDFTVDEEGEEIAWIYSIAVKLWQHFAKELAQLVIVGFLWVESRHFQVLFLAQLGEYFAECDILAHGVHRNLTQ